MKPFNLEEALAGKPVIDNRGNPVRVLCADRKTVSKFNLVCLVEICGVESVQSYSKYGESATDLGTLHMASTKKEGWINLYENAGVGSINIHGGTVYSSESEAMDYAAGDCIATVKVEWDE